MVSYKKVNRPTARKMYNEGITIHLIPCKVSANVLAGVPHDFDWLRPIEISLLSSLFDENRFDRDVKAFEYSKCCAGLGYYAHFLVREEDYEIYQMCKMMCN